MNWPGGKDGSGVAQRLINQIPPCDVFISAFLGDCAILRRLKPARQSIGIDLDEDALRTWLGRRIPGLQLYRCDAIEWLRHRFDQYRYSCRDAGSAGPGPSRRSCSAGSGGQIQPPNVAAAAGDATIGGRVLLDGTPDVPASADVSASGGGRSTIAGGDAASGGGTSSIFVYADPPYPMCTRSSGPLYRHEMTDQQHVQLLETLLCLPCLVMVSSYPSDLYGRALDGWRTFRFQAMTRGGRLATEQVWCNYPEPEQLHDSRYLGNDKREREKIRRRRRNWTEGLDRMPPLERQAILDAITSRHIPRPGTS